MEKTISSAILTKGISKEGFTNLVNDIEYAVIDEGIDIITEESDKIINKQEAQSNQIVPLCK